MHIEFGRLPAGDKKKETAYVDEIHHASENHLTWGKCLGPASAVVINSKIECIPDFSRV
jgi:hypothetical protein